MNDLLVLREDLQKFTEKELGANIHGSGTDLITGESDFTFDLNKRSYSVRVQRLGVREKVNG